MIYYVYINFHAQAQPLWSLNDPILLFFAPMVLFIRFMRINAIVDLLPEGFLSDLYDRNGNYIMEP